MAAVAIMASEGATYNCDCIHINKKKRKLPLWKATQRLRDTPKRYPKKMSSQYIHSTSIEEDTRAT